MIFSAAALRASSSFFFVESATTASITSLVILEDAGVLHLARGHDCCDAMGDAMRWGRSVR